MEITAEQKISHAADVVFETVRDKQAELTAYMPNIESCTVKSREDNPPETKMVNSWQATLDDVPRVVRPFVSPELVSWIDYATWNESTLSCEWRLESLKAKEIFACSGRTEIRSAEGNHSLFVLMGEISIYPEKVPGVPKFLARKMRDPLEKLISSSIRPNLTGIASAVQQYLDKK